MGYLRKLPIRTQLSFIAVLIVIIMIFIILSSYFQTASVVEQKNNEYFTEMISQNNRTIATNCDVLTRMVQNISYSLLIQEYLNETDITKKFVQFKQVRDYISNMISMKDGIIDITLLSNKGTTFNINGDIANIYTFVDEIPKKQLFHYTGMKTIEINNRIRNCFIVGAKIYSTTNFENINNELGTLMIVIDVNTLLGYKNETSNLGDNELYMVDREGKVFFSQDESIKIGSTYNEDLSSKENNKTNVISANGVKYNMQIGEIPDIGGKIIYKVPKRQLLSGIEDIQKQQFLIFFIALLLLAAPFLFVINNILQPLKKLMRFMNEIKSGKLKNLKKRISLRGYAEIIIMADDFNKMLDEIDDLTHRLLETNTRLYETELVKKQSEMAYLQSQINPHFLYNTLESIKGIAVEERVDKIFNMTKALGKVFRYSVKGAGIVGCDEEVKIIKSYLYIQSIRFGKRLSVEYDITEEALNCKVPKMILQPIVENAIYHGIEPKVGEGHLLIGGKISENKLILYIKDDGVGMDNETLEYIRADLAGKSANNMFQNNSINSIGFTNVNNRIKLTYGNEFGLEISSSSGSGTEVTIIMPFRSDGSV